MSELYVYEEDLIEDYGIINSIPKINQEGLNKLKENICNTLNSNKNSNTENSTIKNSNIENNDTQKSKNLAHSESK